MGTSNVPCALKVLSPPEWLVDEGKERRWEERDPPGLVTPIYWPSDPQLPACFASCQSPCGHITGAPETAALRFCTPEGWENTAGALAPSPSTHLLRGTRHSQGLRSLAM